MHNRLRFWPWLLFAAVAGFLVGTDTGCGTSECATPPSKCGNPGPCPGLVTLWVRDGVSKADIERINAEIGATIDPAQDRPPHFQVTLPALLEHPTRVLLLSVEAGDRACHPSTQPRRTNRAFAG